MSTPKDIWDYYLRSKTALDALRRGLSLGWPECVNLFVGEPTNVENQLSDMRKELENQVTMALIASFEALFRLDFENRVGKRKKDPAARQMRALKKKHGKRVSLEDILKVWKAVTGKNAVIDRFQVRLLPHRNWLVHGRYWTQKYGSPPDPDDARNIAEAMFRELPGFPPL